VSDPERPDGAGAPRVGARTRTLVLASRNEGKLRELRALLAPLSIAVLSLDEAGAKGLTVVEDGATFEANAEKKARAAARATTLLALADDSGLEVDALEGRPGVRSARFAHEHATDAENNAALLAALDGVPDAERTARFRCVLCLVDPWAAPNAPPVFFRGVCEGRIAAKPSGAGGFGYDPLFLVAEANETSSERSRTMAELAEDEKARISHRGGAFRALQATLTSVLSSTESPRNHVESTETPPDH
jgi:XTP/dITP diphosphohydrolase